MRYTKPEITTMGDASQLIQNTQLKGKGQFDLRNPSMLIDPAYDLDE